MVFNVGLWIIEGSSMAQAEGAGALEIARTVALPQNKKSSENH